MWICARFDGDDWSELQSAQHDVYHTALWIIVSDCKDQLRIAERLAGVDPDPDLQPDQIDHRTLQTVHDHLAAYWRWSHGYRQPTLGFLPSVPDLIQAWLAWLRAEVHGWMRDHPDLTRDILIACGGKANTDSGYAAEDRLLESLDRVYRIDPATQT